MDMDQFAVAPVAWPAFCGRNRHNERALVHQPANNSKRKPLHRVLPVYAVHRRKSHWIRDDLHQCRIHRVAESLGVPIKGFVEIVARTREKINGRHPAP